MKILFLSFYYSPDLSAGSFRSSQLIKAMIKQLPQDAHIDVITTQPNRYSSYQVDALECEDHPNLTIHRIKTPAHKNGMLDQIKAYVTYVKYAYKLTRNRNYQLVYGTSGRLMTAVLSAVIARKKNIPLYLDIRDIFVDTISDIFPSYLAIPLQKVFSIVEYKVISNAEKVNLISGGFKEYFEGKYPNKLFTYFTNSISKDLVDYNKNKDFSTWKKSNLPLSVLYAGNIGVGQGLHKIIPKLAKQLEDRVVFNIYGDGGCKKLLESQLLKFEVNNVNLFSPIERSELLKEYHKADVLFVHLNEYDAFKKVLPSKLFDYAATGKPIWAGVSGYAAEFISLLIENSAVFNPCDVDAAIREISNLSVAISERKKFVNEFSETIIYSKMSEDILSLLSSKNSTGEF